MLVATFIAEKILGGLIAGADAYLPYGLLNPLLGMSGATTSRGAAAVTLTGITAAIGFIGYALLLRRDVTETGATAVSPCARAADPTPYSLSVGPEQWSQGIHTGPS